MSAKGLRDATREVTCVNVSAYLYLFFPVHHHLNRLKLLFVYYYVT